MLQPFATGHRPAASAFHLRQRMARKDDRSRRHSFDAGFHPFTDLSIHVQGVLIRRWRNDDLARLIEVKILELKVAAWTQVVHAGGTQGQSGQRRPAASGDSNHICAPIRSMCEGRDLPNALEAACEDKFPLQDHVGRHALRGTSAVLLQLACCFPARKLFACLTTCAASRSGRRLAMRLGRCVRAEFVVRVCSERMAQAYRHRHGRETKGHGSTWRYANRTPHGPEMKQSLGGGYSVAVDAPPRPQCLCLLGYLSRNPPSDTTNAKAAVLLPIHGAAIANV